MKTCLSFSDVRITPKFSYIPSRSPEYVDLSSNFLGIPFSLPIVSSNMDTVTSAPMTHAMSDAGGIGCLHRFMSIEDNVTQYKLSPELSFLSVGVGETELERFKQLHNAGATHFVLDVAHGANYSVIEQVKAMRKLRGYGFSLVVGNFATGNSIKDFLYHLEDDYAVQAFKVGIGSGAACLTSVVTGCGWPLFSSVVDCVDTGWPIIADGGIRDSGDFAKALGAGASMVMLGRLLAGTDESPGEVWAEYYLDNNTNYTQTSTYEFYKKLVNKEHLPLKRLYKKYRGSASAESYKVQGKEASWRTPEGDSYDVPYKGSVEDVLRPLEAGLRSAMSYVGASGLNVFPHLTEFVQITANGQVEGSAHGKNV